jgi:hypothetical protein
MLSVPLSGSDLESAAKIPCGSVPTQTDKMNTIESTHSIQRVTEKTLFSSRIIRKPSFSRPPHRCGFRGFFLLFTRRWTQLEACALLFARSNDPSDWGYSDCTFGFADFGEYPLFCCVTGYGGWRALEQCGCRSPLRIHLPRFCLCREAVAFPLATCY